MRPSSDVLPKFKLKARVWGFQVPSAVMLFLSSPSLTLPVTSVLVPLAPPRVWLTPPLTETSLPPSFVSKPASSLTWAVPSGFFTRWPVPWTLVSLPSLDSMPASTEVVVLPSVSEILPEALVVVFAPKSPLTLPSNEVVLWPSLFSIAAVMEAESPLAS